MKIFTKRTITSIVYVVVWVVLCLMKWLVPSVAFGGRDVYLGSLGFDAIFCAISVIGSIEFLNAISRTSDGFANSQANISAVQRSFAIAFCAIAVPLYVIIQLTMPGEGFLACACAFTVYVVFVAATSVFDHGNSTVKGAIYCTFVMLYCGVLPVFFSAINHLPANSMAALLTLFFCTVFTDVGAYLIGKTFKKFIPLKLAPKLSPNKTVIGSAGGILGGILGAICAYLLMMTFGGLNGGAAWLVNASDGVFLTFTSEAIHPIVSFVLIGFVTSVMAQIGDLFESAIKRECGIKDMGKILPGHGGILDRFDSMLYCSAAVLFCFGTIII